MALRTSLLPLLQQIWLPGRLCAGAVCSWLAQSHMMVCTSSAAAADNKAVQPQKQQQQRNPAKSASNAAAQQGNQQAHVEFDSQLQQFAQQYQRSRMQEFYTEHLARDLLLKLNMRNAQQLPAVRSIDLAISAKDLLGRRYAEKWEMLLPALALEYITGQPAKFVQSGLKYYRSRNAITAVKVRVQQGTAMDLLQKLVYVVLPSQNAFGGVNSKSFDRGGNLHFRIPKMINFPDFEEQFELFENLGALHVSINIHNPARHRHYNRLLLTGLQLPILSKQADVTESSQAIS